MFKQTIKNYIETRKVEMLEELWKIPNLSMAIIQVGKNPASTKYVTNKIKDCTQLGIPCSLVSLPETITEKELLQEVDKLNNNPDIKGFIVQMPLPAQINEETIKLAVCPEKDIDGFNVLNKKCWPATPAGIHRFLKSQGYEFSGKNAVILGRSNIVGKPARDILLKENMNVINLHTKTTEEDKKFYLAHADLIIVATGHRHSLTREYDLKKTAVIFDVGINFDENGKICGDCDYADLVDNVEFISPVPSGVGLLTRHQLIENLMILNKG